MLKSNGWNWQWSSSKPHQNIQSREKDKSFNFIGYENYHHIFIERWKSFNVSLGTKKFILNSIKRSNHPSFPLVHEGWGGHWLGGRSSTNFHWKNITSSRRGHGKRSFLRFLSCFLEEEKDLKRGGKWVWEKN